MDCLYNLSPITMATPTENTSSTVRATERVTVMAASRLLLSAGAVVHVCGVRCVCVYVV